MLALAWISLAVALGGCLLGLRAYQQALLSEPNQLRLDVESLAQLVRQLQADSEGRDGKMIAWRAEIEATMEAVEGMLDSVETKRRRIAAATSRKNGADQPTDWAAVARERGLL